MDPNLMVELLKRTSILYETCIEFHFADYSVRYSYEEVRKILRCLKHIQCEQIAMKHSVVGYNILLISSVIVKHDMEFAKPLNCLQKFFSSESSHLTRLFMDPSY